MGICGSKDSIAVSNKTPTSSSINRKPVTPDVTTDTSGKTTSQESGVSLKQQQEKETDNTATNQLAQIKHSQAQSETQQQQSPSLSLSQPHVRHSSTSSSKLKSKQTLQTVTENVESKNSKKAKTQAKVLLLGAGESGKSTILKQIKIIHQNGFTESEKLDYKPFVFQNICEAAQSIIKALKEYDLLSQLVNVTSEDMDFILNYEVPFEVDENEFMNPKVADIIENLTSDAVVENLLKSPDYDFYILDSASYFFQNLNRIRAQGYLPNETDILRTRKQTSGIFDTKFQMEDLDIDLYDVGGQRSERKKWIHCFDNVTAIIFCVALSEYDQTLLESPTKNRLEESLNLFESVVNSMWFRRTAVILCLNKIDLFIEKLPYSPMKKYFPDYVGGANVNKAVKYILWRFKQLNRANLNMVPYVTQATDTNNIKLAFAIVRETILHNNLVDSGIING